jgi:hypothetical protein
MRLLPLLALSLLVTSRLVEAAPPPQAVVALWAGSTTVGAEIGDAMPLRFVLLDDGQVFVGGTSEIVSGKIDKGDIRAFEKQLDKVRKVPGLPGPVTLGPGDRTFRVSTRKSGEIVAKGDPAAASGAVKPLGQLIQVMLDYQHASLRPFNPPSFALAARETGLPGGCRSWTLPVALADALKQPVLVQAAATYGWPTGGTPAVVCDSDRRYAVTLRPLVPGETP